MNIRKSLSDALQAAKKEAGCTYQDLMDGTGCSKSSIRYALNGGANVSLDVYEKLFKYLECGLQITKEIKEQFARDFV